MSDPEPVPTPAELAVAIATTAEEAERLHTEIAADTARAIAPTVARRPVREPIGATKVDQTRRYHWFQPEPGRGDEENIHNLMALGERAVSAFMDQHGWDRERFKWYGEPACVIALLSRRPFLGVGADAAKYAVIATLSQHADYWDALQGSPRYNDPDTVRYHVFNVDLQGQILWNFSNTTARHSYDDANLFRPSLAHIGAYGRFVGRFARKFHRTNSSEPSRKLARLDTFIRKFLYHRWAELCRGRIEEFSRPGDGESESEPCRCCGHGPHLNSHSDEE